jgi:hypothetical protein
MVGPSLHTDVYISSVQDSKYSYETSREEQNDPTGSRNANKNRYNFQIQFKEKEHKLLSLACGFIKVTQKATQETSSVAAPTKNFTLSSER